MIEGKSFSDVLSRAFRRPEGVTPRWTKQAKERMTGWNEQIIRITQDEEDKSENFLNILRNLIRRPEGVTPRRTSQARKRILDLGKATGLTDESPSPGSVVETDWYGGDSNKPVSWEEAAE